MTDDLSKKMYADMQAIKVSAKRARNKVKSGRNDEAVDALEEIIERVEIWE